MVKEQVQGKSVPLSFQLPAPWAVYSLDTKRAGYSPLHRAELHTTNPSFLMSGRLCTPWTVRAAQVAAALPTGCHGMLLHSLSPQMANTRRASQYRPQGNPYLLPQSPCERRPQRVRDTGAPSARGAACPWDSVLIHLRGLFLLGSSIHSPRGRRAPRAPQSGSPGRRAACAVGPGDKAAGD